MGFQRAITAPQTARDLVAQASGILLDWDGCAAMSNRPHADAMSFIQQFRTRIAIVSNNSTDRPEDISAILKANGVMLPPSQIFLAGTEALHYASTLRKERVMILGTPRMKAVGHQLGLNLVQSNASTIVLLRDTRFSYPKLERAVDALAKGAKLIVANSDTTHPGPDGRLVPETGALLAAIAACVDLSGADIRYVGKPFSVLFEKACLALRTAPDAAVMVGDNLKTDIEGASRIGMTSVLVSPGSMLRLADLIPRNATVL
jgi:HAD superfamily hydrolase (TIGR01450 family)